MTANNNPQKEVLVVMNDSCRRVVSNNNRNNNNYNNNNNNERITKRRIMAARRERVSDHPLKSRSNENVNSPLLMMMMVPPDHIVTTTRTHNNNNNNNNTNNNNNNHHRTNAVAEEEESTTSYSSLTTTINTASLIQSAARSVLDSVYNTPPTSATNTCHVSDDEGDDHNSKNECDYYYYHEENNNNNNNNCVGGSGRPPRGVQQQQQQSPLSALQSLRQETLPAMPDEQDRKRFVGCLAAVLASAYDFDFADDDDEDTHARAESYAYLNRSEQGRDSDEEYDEEPDVFDQSFLLGDEEEEPRLDISYDENDEDPLVLSHACNTSFEYFLETTAASASVPDISLCHSDSEVFSMFRQQQQQQQQRNQQKTKSRNAQPIKESILKMNALARNRHRKRRYDVLSKLLLSSAELLLLDKSQARAFLPMLAQLLVPPTASQKKEADRIRQQKLAEQRQQKLEQLKQQQQQQQQQQQNRQNDGTSSSSSVNTTPTKSSVVSSSSNNTNNNNNNNNNSPIRPAEKGINHYYISPTTKMPVSQRIVLPDDEIHLNPDLLEYAKEEDNYFLPNGLDDEDHLRPFLESLSPGAGFRCLSLLLLQHLLTSTEGYDARVRHVIKKLGVIVLLHDMELQRDLELVEEEDGGMATIHTSAGSKSPKQNDRRQANNSRTKYENLVGPATRKFEALEHSIAVRLIRLSRKQQQQIQNNNNNNNNNNQARSNNRQSRSRQQQTRSVAPVPSAPTFSRDQLVRAMKIGSAGLVAGTIFAVTGGLAAPGIAAGVAAIAGSTAATAAVAAIVSSTPAVTAIFGVGGGSLAAYKMNRRTQGLTEFEFRRQDKLPVDRKYEKHEEEEDQAELFSTVCISGWLRDEHDFQRPWGIAPTNPRIRDRLELLERFYSVYRPDHVCKCKKILASWKGEEKQLWELLKQKYGRDPDHLYPIISSSENGFHRGLTLEQEEILDELFVELGYVPASTQHPASRFDNVRENLIHPLSNNNNNNNNNAIQKYPSYPRKSRFNSERTGTPIHNVSAFLDESLHGPGAADGASSASSGFESASSSRVTAGTSQNPGRSGEDKEQYVPPKHLSTVWDYHSKYGGEIYTVKWESEMLIELCDSVTDLAFDVINGATAQILRQTALSTLLSAVAVPYALVNAANMIDGTWTLAVERADEAGKELARSLLFSRAGHRPVTLVGFSFGARAIYSCLKELARYQEKWEMSREHSHCKAAGGICYGGDKSEQYSWTSREPASIVEDVILMGLPNHLSLSSWKACRRVVGGRLVNCYSRKDLILSLMFQFKRLAGVLRPVCGTCTVEVPGVENVDVSDLVLGHQDYCLVTGDILKRVKHGQPFRTSVKFVGDANLAMIGN